MDILDVNGNKIEVYNKVLEVGAPVNEAGTVVGIVVTTGRLKHIVVEWMTDAEGEALDGPVYIEYTSSTDLMVVYGSKLEDGSYITTPPAKQKTEHSRHAEKPYDDVWTIEFNGSKGWEVHSVYMDTSTGQSDAFEMFLKQTEDLTVTWRLTTPRGDTSEA